MKPDEKDVVVERLLEGLEPSLPPPDLRPKVLAAARVRMAAEPVIDVWSVIWENRGVRLAWAGAVALLLAGHVFLGFRNGAVPSRVDPALVAGTRVDEQFVDVLRPTPISDDVQPIVGLFAAGGGLAELDIEGNPS
jgi:hypothetical protein